jgi:putative RecB family exonuclease
MTAQTVTNEPVPPLPGHVAPGQAGLPPQATGPELTAEAADAPGGGPDAGRPARPSGPSLSPSRAADFKTCPLLFRFRTVDRLPEQPSADQVRGTLVHAVLEHLFDLPAADRTPAAAAALVEPQWQRLVEQEPELAALFSTDDTASGTANDTSAPAAVAVTAPPIVPALPLPEPAGTATVAVATGQPAEAAQAEVVQLATFLAGARDLLDGYFAVEDPRRIEPAERESLISTLVDDELLIRGYIDRLDVSPAGDLRVVDYKTGGAPREAFEARALFQMKFYALVLWRTRGIVPKVLRLHYLKDADVLDFSPDSEELERFERTLVALSKAIERAKRDKDFRPKPSRLCGWCNHKAFCPEFGGTLPPYPEPQLDAPPPGLQPQPGTQPGPGPQDGVAAAVS